ncbi:MAG TPA: AAA family ATPase [Ktedonobacterales bacterium]|nr:AAA family ATPase [Ktedonobacterales bacterium]
MATNLLERDAFLLTLDAMLSRVATGSGRTVLITGEAGIGKTSLVERFLDTRQTEARVFWGACEALFTPRPLGPLYDIAQQMGASSRAHLEGDVNRAALFAAVLEDLARGPLPGVLVIEDIHWADEATLDLIKFLARRIHRTATLLVLTYRDDEVGRGHPLRLVLGDLPARDVTRLRLPPLSEVAVAALARDTGRPTDDLYAITGGNPFFVTEVLANDPTGTPTSVRDAVLAQVGRLSHEAQSLLEVVAVAPGKIDWAVVEATMGSAGNHSDSAPLDECLVAGMLLLERGMAAYRHELARQAVESALAPARKRALHAQVLRVLLEREPEQAPLALLAHHAAQAEDGAAVLRIAPQAARQASAQGAHREAATHYETALRYADCLDDEQQAGLLEALSYERYLTGVMQAAIGPRRAALAIWRRLARQEKIGHTLRQMSRLSWFLGDVEQAERDGVEAVELLETLPPGHELAMAYGGLSHLYMLVGDSDKAILWGNRAIALGERIHDDESVCYALNNVGSSELMSDNAGGWAKLERSLQLALDRGYEEHAARAYANLATQLVWYRHYDAGKRFLQEGMAYCSDHDLGSWEHCLRGQQARARLDQGDWVGADEDATAILSVDWASGTNRAPALTVLGRVRVRRGDPGVEPVLDEARDLALITRDLEPMAVTRAEWRWLRGEREQCLAEAEGGYRHALKSVDTWSLGETAFWMWRAGGLAAAPAGIPDPYALQIAGDWRAAANAWERLGCPYDQAMALLDGDEAALRQALEICERLEARPAMELVRKRLRLVGVRGLPRRPRPATRENPQGLTNRQLEILLLLAEGLRNAEIAERLSTTPKTAAHHVSDVLAKLNVRSRAEAVSLAYHLGIIPQMVNVSRVYHVDEDGATDGARGAP